METNLAAKKAQMIKIARLARRILQFVAAALALTFTWLKFRGLNFAPILNDVSAQLLLRATLAAYYFSWVFGLSSDADDQEVIYVEAPERTRVIALCIGSFFGIAIPFGILCYVQSPRAFAGVLSAFLILNVVSWLSLIRWVLCDSVAKTSAYYRSHEAYRQLIELTLFVDDYLRGSWQVWRFCAGAMIVAIVDLLTFTNIYARIGAVELFRSKDLVLAGLLLAFVLIMEVWIWVQRMHCKIGRALLERIEDSYDIRPKAVRTR